MNRASKFSIHCVVLSMCLSFSYFVPRVVAAESLLKEYSQVTIEVDRHPEVSGSYLVHDDGVIKYEFVGDVLVNGLSPDEITQRLKSKLSDYIINPRVSIQVQNQSFVFVAGEVTRAGKTSIETDSISVKDLLAIVGQPLSSANLEKAYILRLISENKRERIRVNLKKLLLDNDLAENKQVYSGDILYVPSNKATNQKRARNFGVTVSSPEGSNQEVKND